MVPSILYMLSVLATVPETSPLGLGCDVCCHRFPMVDEMVR